MICRVISRATGTVLILLSLILIAAMQNIAPSLAQIPLQFIINVNPNVATVEASGNGKVSFTVEPIEIYNNTVTLTAEGVPNALTVTIFPSSGKPGFNGTIFISAASTAEGRYTFTVKGKGEDGLENYASVTVQVPYFQLSIDDECLVAEKGSQTSTMIHVESMYGYSKTVALSISGAPSGVTSSLSPTSSTPSFTSTLTLKVSEEALSGTIWLMVTGIGSDGKTQSESVEFAIVYISINLSKTILLDDANQARGNRDGTYYPGDGFKLTYQVTTENSQFENGELLFDESVFNASKTLNEKAGNVTVELLKTASPGNYTVTVKAAATYTSSKGKIYRIESSDRVQVIVVKYDPKFTVLVTYLVLKDRGNTSYEKPFAVIVRYEGNGLEHNLNERAIIEDYTWEGVALKSLSSEGLSITPEIGAVTFYAAGIDYTIEYEPILTVDGAGYSYYQLPAVFRWSVGSEHSYEWVESVPCLSDPYATFTFQACVGLNRTSTIIAPIMGQVATAQYALTKPLKYFAQGEDPIVNWTGRSGAPLLFNNETRYAKIMINVDDAVMGRVEAANYSQVDLEVTFQCSKFSPSPTKLFIANYTYTYEDFVQPLLIKAFKYEGNEWVTDNSVHMTSAFETPENLTLADIGLVWLGTQSSDEEVWKLVKEDLAEAEPQAFSGAGEIFGNLSKTSFVYNLTITAEGYGRIVPASRLVMIPFGKGETYLVYINLAGGGVDVTATYDTGQYAYLKIFASPESGGLTKVSVYNGKGDLLTSKTLIESITLNRSIFGFAGEDEIYLPKNPNTGTNLTIKAENAWGATTYLTITVKPYTPPAWWSNLNELAFWIFILIIAAIIFNLAIFFIKARYRR